MKAFIFHFLIELKAGFRKRQQLFLTYLFPLGFFLIMGALMPQLNPGFTGYMIPSMLIFSIMASTLLGIPDPLVNDRINGVFRGYKINGVSRLSVFCLPILTTAVHMTIVAAIILFLSPLLFSAPASLNIPALLPLFLLTIFVFSGISLLIGTVAGSSRSANMISQIIFIPSMIIGGLMVPYSFMPHSISFLSLLLPSTHCMNLFQTVMYGDASSIAPGISCAVLGGTGLITLLLSLLLFRWDRGRE